MPSAMPSLFVAASLIPTSPMPAPTSGLNTLTPPAQRGCGWSGMAPTPAAEWWCPWTSCRPLISSQDLVSLAFSLPSPALSARHAAFSSSTSFVLLFTASTHAQLANNECSIQRASMNAASVRNNLV